MKLDFLRMSDEKLFSIWISTNAFEWNEALGPKPDGFDDMPLRRGWKFWIKDTKRDYTRPIFNIVDRLIPSEKLEILRARHLSDTDRLAEQLVVFNPGVRKKHLEKVYQHLSKSLD